MIHLGRARWVQHVPGLAVAAHAHLLGSRIGVEEGPIGGWLANGVPIGIELIGH